MLDNLLLFVLFKIWGGRVFVSFSNSLFVFVFIKDCWCFSRWFGSWEEFDVWFILDEVFFGGFGFVLGFLKFF